MIPRKFKDLANRFKDDDSVFGFYYKNENGVETLGVNGGDWMDEDTYDPIDGWGEINGVEIVYEAEAEDDYFLDLGFERI